MKVLQDPHVTECCGQHFCKACLEKWFERKQQKKVCPHCREAGFAHMMYKPLQRKINELKVHCPNLCGVVLKLQDLHAHLSDSNPSGTRCSRASIQCPNRCGKMVLRDDVKRHTSLECMKREEACSCCSRRMTCDLLANHYEICDKMEVSCPWGCEQQLCRSDLKGHEIDCPCVYVKCPFFDVGCEIEVARGELATHVEKGAAAHLMKFVTGYRDLKADNEQLKADVKSLKADNKSLIAGVKSSVVFKKEFTSFKSQVAFEIARIKDSIEKPNSDVSKSLESIESLLKGYHLDSDVYSIVFSIPPDMKVWKSSPFTVSPGYSMCIRVRLEAMTTVELLLLRSSADDKLKWPMEIKKQISILLYEQNRQREVQSSTVKERVSSVFQGTTQAQVQSIPHIMTVSPDLLTLSCNSITETVVGIQEYRMSKQVAYVRVRLEDTLILYVPLWIHSSAGGNNKHTCHLRHHPSRRGPQSLASLFNRSQYVQAIAIYSTSFLLFMCFPPLSFIT